MTAPLTNLGDPFCYRPISRLAFSTLASCSTPCSHPALGTCPDPLASHARLQTMNPTCISHAMLGRAVQAFSLAWVPSPFCRACFCLEASSQCSSRVLWSLQLGDWDYNSVVRRLASMLKALGSTLGKNKPISLQAIQPCSPETSLTISFLLSPTPQSTEHP